MGGQGGKDLNLDRGHRTTAAEVARDKMLFSCRVTDVVRKGFAL